MKCLTTLLAGLLVGVPLITEKLSAAEWEKDAGLSLGAEFSDNICLSQSDEIDRGFATVTPDIRVRGRGARANMSLSGNVIYNSLGDSDFACADGVRSNIGNRQTFIPSLRYFGDLELIDEWLTLESDASARTTNIDPFAPGDINRLDGRNNTSVVYRYGAGARVQRRVFNSADLRVRYNYNEQINNARLLGDSSESRGEFDLNTDRSGNRLTLGVSGRYSKIMNEGRGNIPAFDNTLSSAEARASIRLSSSWQVSVMGGEEWNEFISLQPDIEGTYWDASVRWSPNDRVDVDVGTGERFFGTTPRASIRYTHKRSQLSAAYNRTLTLPRDLRAASDRLDVPFDPEFDVDDIPPGQLPGVPPTFGGDPTFIGATPVLNERLRLGYRYSGNRTTISANASSSRQRRVEDLGEATFTDVGLNLNRTLSSRLSVSANMNVSEREGQGGNVGLFGEPTRTWRGGLGLNRRLGSSTTVSVNYQHNHRETDADFDGYTENRLILSARHQF